MGVWDEGWASLEREREVFGWRRERETRRKMRESVPERYIGGW